MSQKQIEQIDNLLKDDGTLNHAGYSKKMLLRYNKEAVKKRSRLKEWDYYYITDGRFALGVTIGNLSYAGVISAYVVDFNNKQTYSKSTSVMFPKKDILMNETSANGETSFKTNKADFKFEIRNGERFLNGRFVNFYNDNGQNRDLEFDIKIKNEPEESMVKVTPFKNKKHFSYNHKIVGMQAEGRITFKGKIYVFDNETTLATMFWSRGVLPYKSTWYWASMQAKTRTGNIIGFNLGKSLGYDTDATENMIFVDGKVHKIGGIKIYIQKEGFRTNYLGTWTFYSDDGRIELIFEPYIQKKKGFNALIFKHKPNQVFGKYHGKVILDDGQEIDFENMPGFAERVDNRW